MRGKMVFSASQVRGRVGAVTFNLLNKHGGGRIRPDLDTALGWWEEAVCRRSKPRKVKVGDGKPPILIFTDGAHETEAAGYGGIMIDPLSGEVAGFGRNMGETMKRRLTVQGKKQQIIGQAELYPAIVARRLWKHKIQGRDVIHMVDNDSARFALIKGSSPCLESAWLVQSFWIDESATDCQSWIARVPSRSNIADGPSRGDRTEASQIFPHIQWLEWNDAQEEADARSWLI